LCSLCGYVWVERRPQRGHRTAKGRQSPPHPEPGCVAATGEIPPLVEVVVEPPATEVVEVVDTLWEGVTDTSWKMPAASRNTTTIAGALADPTCKVPLPCPPVAESHESQVMPVTVVIPLAHPTVILVGRTCRVDPGPHESTATRGDKVDVVRGDVVVDTEAVVVEAPVVVDVVVDGEDLEATLRPAANARPRAARASTAMPTRRTVLRRTVMTRGSLFTTQRNRSPACCRSGSWPHHERVHQNRETGRGGGALSTGLRCARRLSLR
jgi:hypothetical protein